MSQDQDIALEEQFAQKRMSKQTFLRLMAYLRPYKRQFVLNLAFTTFATASSLLGPKFIQVGIDRFLTDFTSAEAALSGILMVSVIYLVNLFAGWFLSVAQVKTSIAIGQGAMNDLRKSVFAHIQSLSLNFFDRTRQGRIISRADSDINSLDQVLTWGANQLLSSGLTLLGACAILLQYEWRLCLAVSSVLPILAVATRVFQVRVLRAYRRLVEQGSRVTAALAENVSGVRVVQAFSREDLNLERFREINSEYAERFTAAARIFHVYIPLIPMLSGVGTAIILGYGGHLAMRNEITVGELAAFIIYLGMFFGPIQTMGDLYNSVLSAAASSERIFQLLETRPQVIDLPSAGALPRIEGRVQFENVSFRYETTPADKWILDRVSFEILPGQMVALVGSTGSGKTTIASLLARFYEPQLGRILIDGLDLLSTTIESLRSQIGIVTQENFLFTGSIMENLKFGRPSATDGEVIEAAQMLGTHEMILGLQEGYQTDVSERGGNLSAGERQLITFTRAMVARPRILILDEATSAVDSQTESVIQNALEKLFEKRTSFVIAHRLSTVRHADQILVLKDGEIVESGTHERLLLSKGRYSQLHDEFVRQ
jgi:ABC-type multidrug transport system fused ATPase/permease subunit